MICSKAVSTISVIESILEGFTLRVVRYPLLDVHTGKRLRTHLKDNTVIEFAFIPKLGTISERRSPTAILFSLIILLITKKYIK